MVYSDLYSTTVTVCNIVTVIIDTVILIFCSHEMAALFHLLHFLFIEHNSSLVAST